MSAPNDYGHTDDNYRPRPAQYRNDRNERSARSYGDRSRRPSSRDRYRRTPSPPRRQASPHDRHRSSRDGYGATGGYSAPRNFDSRQAREEPQGSGGYRQGRMHSPNGRRLGYVDRDSEGYRSPVYDSRSRSRSRSPPRRDRSPHFGAPPSREVILEGIPVDMQEEDVSKQLKQGYGVEQLDDVRVIRDRQTKVSRGFGFLKFPSIDLAKAFLERNFPSIYLYGRDSADNDSPAAKVRIDFSRERDERPRGDKEGEWTCKICTFINFPGRMKCFKCQSPQIDMSTFGNAPAVKQPPSMNSGDSDASPNGTPSQFLLLRGLEPTVSEDLLAKGVSKLYKPSRRSSPPTASSSKKGISKVASTTGDANLGAKEGSLRRVLLVRDRKSNESWRYGFAEFATVEEAQAAFVRFNSFDKFTISSKPVTVNYVHAGVFVPVFSASDPDEFCFNPLGNTATKLAYWDKEAYVSQLAVSSGPADSSTGAADSQVKSSADIAAAAAEGEGLLQSGKENEVKAKKRKAEATNAAAKLKKTAPAHLQFWSNRHAELHGIKSEPSQDQNTDDPKSKKGSSGAAAEDNSTPTETFANPEKKCCYLCSRQFKAEAEVYKHERLSQLHRDNLKNDQIVAQARAKMAKAGLSTTVITQGDGSEYRDRAKERRAAFGGSKKISLPLKKQASQPEHTESNVSEQPPPPSKGASLLGKMGWSAGEGLGAQGTGRTEAIATEMYVQGVGLGAQGGKIGDAVDEAGRNTVGGYAGFAERTRDKAKERFEKMG